MVANVLLNLDEAVTKKNEDTEKSESTEKSKK